MTIEASAPAGGGEVDLAGLVAARLCHDLVSPVGAISNGLELLEMTGGDEELALVRHATEAAAARLRLYRLAFGAAAADQMVRSGEVAEIVAQAGRDGRVRLDWSDGADRPRPEIRAALLGMMCLEGAAPWGGRVAATRPDGAWRIELGAERLKDLGPLWDALDAGAVPPGLSAGEVQFGLLVGAMAALGRRARMARGPAGIVLTL